MDFRKYLSAGDYADLFWAHGVDVQAVRARLRTFPEGLSAEAVRARLPKPDEAPFALPMLPDHTTNARVRRQGFPELVVPWSQVVDGDVVLFGPGEAMLADVRILVTADGAPVVSRPLRAALMGGLNVSEMRVQHCADVENPEVPWWMAHNMLWAGSVVMRGSGEGVVVHTRALCTAALFQRTASKHGAAPMLPLQQYSESHGLSWRNRDEFLQRVKCVVWVCCSLPRSLRVPVMRAPLGAS